MTSPSPTTRRSNRLYRDPIDKKIGGVASGVARYFDIDTTLMRAIWAASILVGGFGLFLYLVLWFILDEDPELLASEGQVAEIEPALPAVEVDAKPEPVAENTAALEEEDVEEETRDPELESS